MTQGAAGGPINWDRRVLRLALPFILSNLSVPLMGAVDTAVMGHQADPAYLGAVAVGAAVFSLVFWAFGFLRMGTTAFTAQAAGAGDSGELRAAFARPAIIGLVIALMILALQVPIGAIAIGIVDPSESVESLAWVYYDVRIWGAPATLLIYVLFGWLRGLEKAGTVLALTLLMNGGNVALTLFLVLELDMGIAGAALGTVIAEYITLAVGALVVAHHLGTVRVWDWQAIKDKARLLALFKVNRDILLRTICLEAAFLLFMHHSAQFSDTQLAANVILLQFQTIMAYGLDGFADSAEILGGSAYGARSRARFVAAVKASARWGLILSLLVTLGYFAAGEWLVGLFTSLEEVRAATAVFLPWVIASPLVSVWSFLFDGIFIGTTHTGEMRNGMLASLAVFAVASFVLIGPFGNHGLWLAFLNFIAARGITLGLFLPRILAKLA